MKKQLTDAQILFCIIFTLQHNLKLYGIQEKKSFIGKIIKKKLILDYINYTKSYFDNSETYNQNYKFDSIIKLINYSLFMSFNNTISNYELSLLKDFRHSFMPNKFNDLNLILDFWYSIGKDVFRNNNDYKTILLNAIKKSFDADKWIVREKTPTLSPDGSRIKSQIILQHKPLGDISSYMLNYIEQELDKPDWLQDPTDIIQRLKFSRNYPDWLLDMTEFIFKSTKFESKSIFPKEINDKELIVKYMSKNKKSSLF
jgi:hypothetical protein